MQQEEQQQQPYFYNSSQHLPQTPDSAGILIATAASAANERRAQKTIMNCFRDRTPSSYTRSNNQHTRANIIPVAKKLPSSHQIPESGVVVLKEPRPRPIKLTLLKSSSSKDLTRLYDFESYYTKPQPLTPLSSSSSTDLHKMTSSSNSTNSSSCSRNCSRRMQQMEQKLEQLEKQLDEQSKETKAVVNLVNEMQKKMDLFLKEQQEKQNKPKKHSSMRVIRKESSSSSIQTGVQPSKLVAWMKLSNFWKQRPSLQTLKDQEIYKGNEI